MIMSRRRRIQRPEATRITLLRPSSPVLPAVSPWSLRTLITGFLWTL